ncbi:MAG: uracil-DNA glycosylase [Candidatus Thermoplasmatota archaeon]|nr:uracil-DNA glycosylase [Candidatus Thermoplasmatota archaeon]
MAGLWELENKIKNCKNCPLSLTRKNAVPGEGREDANIIFIGEAPGKSEDETGKPFVGKAGNFLDFALTGIGLKREDIYITNVVKCRPPGNRDPREEEIKACIPYLDGQISIIKPKIFCTLGKFATTYILSSYGFDSEPISRVHGRVYSSPVAMIKIIPMYHPAATIYNPALKEYFLRDMGVIKKLLD